MLRRGREPGQPRRFLFQIDSRISEKAARRMRKSQLRSSTGMSVSVEQGLGEAEQPEGRARRRGTGCSRVRFQKRRKKQAGHDEAHA